MPFPITCSACGKSFAITDDVYERKVLGRVVTIKCKQCQAGIRVDGTQAKPTSKSEGLSATRPEARSIIDEMPSSAPPPMHAAPAPAPAAAPASEEGGEVVWAVDNPDGEDRELSSTQIAAELKAGSLDATTLVWRDGMDEWQELGQVEELARLIAKPVGAAPKPAEPRVLSATAPSAPAAIARAEARKEPAAPAARVPAAVPAPGATRVGASPVAAPKGSSSQQSRPFAAQTPAGPPRAGAAQASPLGGPRPAPAPAPPVAPAAAPTPAAAPAPPVAPAPVPVPAPPPLAASAPQAAASPTAPPAFASAFAAPEASPAAPAASPPTPDAEVAVPPHSPFDDVAAAAPSPFGAAPGATAPAFSPPAFAAPPPVSPAVAPAPAPSPRRVPPAPGASTEGMGLVSVAVNPFLSTPGLSGNAPGAPPFGAAVAVPDAWSQPKNRTPMVIGVLAVVAVLAVVLIVAVSGSSDSNRIAPSELAPLPPSTPTHNSRPREPAAQTENGDSTEPAAAKTGMMGEPVPASSAGFAEAFAAAARRAEDKQHGDGSGFVAAAARDALAGAGAAFQGCKQADAGKFTATVTFEPSGRVSSAFVGGAPFAGTPVADCLTAALKRVTVAPFSGAPGTVTETLAIQ